MADYAAKELNLKRVATISDDFAFGHEQMAAFQRVFEDTALACAATEGNCRTSL
jgi:branched-chain amino acid transport system substrate-binding protein